MDSLQGKVFLKAIFFPHDKILTHEKKCHSKSSRNTGFVIYPQCHPNAITLLKRKHR